MSGRAVLRSSTPVKLRRLFNCDTQAFWSAGRSGLDDD